MIFGILYVLYAPVEAISSQVYCNLVKRAYPPEIAQAYIEARENAEQILIDSFKNPDEGKKEKWTKQLNYSKILAGI